MNDEMIIQSFLIGLIASIIGGILVAAIFESDQRVWILIHKRGDPEYVEGRKDINNKLVSMTYVWFLRALGYRFSWENSNVLAIERKGLLKKI